MEELADGVRSVLSEDGELTLTPVPGGASRETWLVQGKRGRWVLRRDPEGSVSLVPIAEEFALLDLAREAGVRVPEPLALEPAGGSFGSAGMLMSFVEGTSVGPRILRKPEFQVARSRLTAQLAEALARIHSIELAALDGVLPPHETGGSSASLAEPPRFTGGSSASLAEPPRFTGGSSASPGEPPRITDPAVAQIDEWERQLDEIGGPLPTVELGLRWLRANAPKPVAARLVHGDFRLGNF